MGYEIKLIIGTVHKALPDDPADLYLIEVAMIDLCKSCFGNTWIDESDKKNTIYFCDIGTNVSDDLYGSKLYPIDPKKVLAKIKENNKGKDKYRRYNAAIPLLENLIADFPDEGLKCILYGH